MENSTIRFYRDKKYMGFLSEQAGHPVHEDADFIEFYIPGDMKNQPTREATDRDKHQYAMQFAQYKQGLEPSVQGTALETWPRMTPATVANYKAQKFQTIEQVAEMSDQICNQVGMGAMSDKIAAKAYLALAKDSSLAQKQALIIDRLERSNEDLQRQIKELAAAIERPQAAIEKPRLGRPPKVD